MFRENNLKINSTYILVFGRPKFQTSQCKLYLAQYRFIFKKIFNNEFDQNAALDS